MLDIVNDLEMRAFRPKDENFLFIFAAELRACNRQFRYDEAFARISEIATSIGFSLEFVRQKNLFSVKNYRGISINILHFVHSMS